MWDGRLPMTDLTVYLDAVRSSVHASTSHPRPPCPWCDTEHLANLERLVRVAPGLQKSLEEAKRVVDSTSKDIANMKCERNWIILTVNQVLTRWQAAMDEMGGTG